jgi:hypothetical protein
MIDDGGLVMAFPTRANRGSGLARAAATTTLPASLASMSLALPKPNLTAARHLRARKLPPPLRAPHSGVAGPMGSGE